MPTAKIEPAATIPTPDEIEAAKGPKGAWSRATLASWGVPWPPPSGWRKDLESKSGVKRKQKPGKVAAIEGARTHQDALRTRLSELGVTMEESLVQGVSPHWRFYLRGICVMQYWPATKRWWMKSDGKTGKCEPDRVVDFLAAEIDDLQKTLN